MNEINIEDKTYELLTNYKEAFNEEEFKEKYPELVKDNPLLYSTKKAIAQGIIHKVEEVNIKEISLENLLNIPSKRGDKGWGSSNKN